MSRYAAVYTKIWRDEKFQTLNDETKMLFLYLLTSPHSNLIGFYYLPIAYIAEDLRKDFETVRQGLDNLSKNGLVMYDSAAKVVLVKNYLKYNLLQNPNQAKGAIAVVSDMPRTPLITDFLRCVQVYCPDYMDHFQTLKEQFEKGFGTVAKPGPGSGSGSGSEISTYAPLSGAPEQSPKDPLEQQEQPGEQRERTKTPEIPDEPPVMPAKSKRQRAKTPANDVLFVQFWAAYPKKRSRGQAEKAWAKINPDEQLVDVMLAAIERAKKSEDWRKEGGRYIPYPATWLNAKGWEDDYQPLEVINGGRRQEHSRHPQGEDDYSDLVVR